MRWVQLGFWIVLCLGVGAVGGRWTAPEIPAWYRELNKPGFNPPGWIFGPVWTLLYILMACAVWKASAGAAASVADLGLRNWCIAVFLAQLALNLAWSWIFFHRHAIGAAAVEVVAMWCAIGATTLLFARVSPVAAWLMVPYWAWVSFASILNISIWRLNRMG